MSVFLGLLAPKIILDVNWISAYHTFYKAWTKKNRRSKFVVLQHGSYIGGIVSDKAHRYTKCDVFLTWGDYFTGLFRGFNAGKRVAIVNFGNPIFNQFKRSAFQYSERENRSVLLAPSVINETRLKSLLSFYRYLTDAGYNVCLKEHKLQSAYGTEIADVPKDTTGIFQLLQEKTYDIIITDHSSVLLDAIFFKNKVLIFSDPDSVEEFKHNVFTQYLGNLYDDFTQKTLNENLYEKVNLGQQEALFQAMVHCSDNNLNIL